MKSTIVLILLFFPAWACAGTVQVIKQLDLSVQGIKVLMVSCGAGSLDLKGLEGRDKIGVSAEIEVEDLQQEDLQKFIENNVRLKLEKHNEKALLISEIPQYALNGLKARINLAIVIPRKLDVKITDGSGSIRVRNLIGNVKIDDDSGKISIENIVGELTINDGSGEIEIEDIRGKVMLRDGSGPIQIDHIQGDVYVTDGSGDMTIVHVDGNVTVSDDSGDIDISDVSKNVFIKESISGELNIERVKGKITTRE